MSYLRLPQGQRGGGTFTQGFPTVLRVKHLPFDPQRCVRSLVLDTRHIQTQGLILGGGPGQAYFFVLGVAHKRRTAQGARVCTRQVIEQRIDRLPVRARDRQLAAAIRIGDA